MGIVKSTSRAIRSLVSHLRCIWQTWRLPENRGGIRFARMLVQRNAARVADRQPRQRLNSRVYCGQRPAGDVAAVILAPARRPGIGHRSPSTGTGSAGWLRLPSSGSAHAAQRLWHVAMSHSDVGRSSFRNWPLVARSRSPRRSSRCVRALPLGVLAGVPYKRLSGALIRPSALLGIAVPAFWAGLLLATVFAIQLKVLPRAACRLSEIPVAVCAFARIAALARPGPGSRAYRLMCAPRSST